MNNPFIEIEGIIIVISSSIPVYESLFKGIYSRAVLPAFLIDRLIERIRRDRESYDDYSSDVL